MNVISLFPVHETGVLPRQSQGPRSIGDIAREQLVQIAMRQEKPLGALMHMDVADLRKSRREIQRHLLFMRGVRANADSWRSLLSRDASPEPLRAFAEHQVSAARSLCREYLRRLRLLRLAIQFIEANQPTPAA